jgi:hypothetical protein
MTELQSNACLASSANSQRILARGGRSYPISPETWRMVAAMTDMTALDLRHIADAGYSETVAGIGTMRSQNAVGTMRAQNAVGTTRAQNAIATMRSQNDIGTMRAQQAQTF